jgi:hypothetical protein
MKGAACCTCGAYRVAKKTLAVRQEEALMAIVVVNVITDGTEEMYEAVTGKVMADNQLPEGCRVHIAGPVKDGWRVITVWDSEDAFKRFREEKLIPALREVAGEEAVAPKIGVRPVHKLITA